MVGAVCLFLGYFWCYFTIDNNELIRKAKMRIRDEIKWEVENGTQDTFYVYGTDMKITKWRDGSFVGRFE